MSDPQSRPLSRHVLALALIAAIAGCMAGGAPPPGADATSASGPLGSPFSDRRMGLGTSVPLILDRTDLRLGTSVVFRRIPTETDLYDATQTTALAHVVILLPAWPAEFAELQALNRVPTESDLIVVLPGYPPSRGAAEAWNMVNARLRMVVVVNAPPPSNTSIGDLNTLRGLERVIVDTDAPSRSGFERLQRPLSFRRLVD